MDIIQSFLPLNTKEKIDQLVNRIQEMPDAMNQNIRQEIFLNIRKIKLQIYFDEKYPDTFFKDSAAKVNLDLIVPVPNQAASSSMNNSANETMIKLPACSLGSKKYIYGTYIEMAFHNFFLNMRHIYKMVVGEDIMGLARQNYIPKKEGQQWDEDFANEALVWRPIFQAFRHALPEDATRIEELIARHFPMLVVIKDFTVNSRNYKELSSVDVLERFSQTLRVLRNVYSHYKIELKPNQINVYERNEDFVAESLKHAFLGSKRIVKTRFDFSDTDLQCTEQYKFRTDSRQRDSRGRAMRIKEEISGFRYGITERNSQHLSPFGLVFLTSLFLEKKYSKILTDKLRIIPQKDQSVVNELIAVYRIRLTNEKFHVTKDTDALAFDILTELRRCPEELFEHLKPEDRKKFRVTDDTEMVRHRDRFPHLIMKYIDDAKLFETIRFQVSLGKYFFKFYDKYCIDNEREARVRALSKNVNGFGRLSEIETARNANWDDSIRKYEDVHKNTTDEEPYVTDHHPRYVINGNRIAMRIFNQEPGIYLPELTTDGARNLAPSCWMSIYELPAMAFLLHLKNASEVENIIKSTVANYRKLFSDIQEGILLPVESEKQLTEILSAEYNSIDITDIPKDITDYLLNRNKESQSHFEQCAISLIDKLIEQTLYKKERFIEQRKLAANPKQNRIGKRSFVRIQPGKLAAFLAKDMMFFQPNNSENKNKLTGMNFNILQSVLALYNNGNIEYLKRTLQSAHIIGKPDDKMCNPIVMRIMQRRIQPGNIYDFYVAYLDERLAYLTECKLQNKQSLSFLHSDRMRWQQHDEDFYKAKAGRYLKDHTSDVEKPIELPRGMFDKYIREELKGMASMKNLAADPSKNISYLIYGYFKNVMLDDCSPIYEAPRTYALLNALYRTSPSSPEVYYSAQQIRNALIRNNAYSFHKDIKKYIEGLRPAERNNESEHIACILKNLKDNETTLKRYKIQDIIMFLIAKKLLMSDKNDNERIVAINNIHLRDILDKDALSQKIRFSITITSANGWNKTISQDNLKLKDYAKFYRFLNDRRLPSLLDLVNKTQIEKTLIEEELTGYDKVHTSILEMVFECERQYVEQHSDVKTTIFSDIIKKDNTFKYDEQKVLKNTRNAFAHCSYPKYNQLGNEARGQNIPRKAIAISEGFTEILKK